MFCVGKLKEEVSELKRLKSAPRSDLGGLNLKKVGGGKIGSDGGIEEVKKIKEGEGAESVEG
jgi:hypothetical protein